MLTTIHRDATYHSGLSNPLSQVTHWGLEGMSVTELVLSSGRLWALPLLHEHVSGHS